MISFLPLPSLVTLDKPSQLGSGAGGGGSRARFPQWWNEESHGIISVYPSDSETLKLLFIVHSDTRNNLYHIFSIYSLFLYFCTLVIHSFRPIQGVR